jgi:spermidine synthase
VRQNAVPFDDFHVRLGAVPALIHPAPRRALVIGLGMGSTPHGLAVDPRVEHATCVEICPGELPLLDSMYRKGMRELEPLLSSPRLDYRFEDGRKFLLDSVERFDLVVTDTLLPLSPFSGSLYSREFYQLVSSRLRVNGMFAQWVPSRRILETAASVFPFVFVIEDPASPASSKFLVASNRPIKLDRNALLERNRAADRTTLPPEARRDLEAFLARAVATPVVGRDFPLDQLNTDLFPRDEFSSW